MPGIATRADLVTRITSILFNRSDITAADTDAWIQMAEAEMRRKLPVRLAIGVNAAFAIASEYVNVPADFAGAISLEIPGNTPPVTIEERTPQQLVRERRGRSIVSGTPSIFCIVGSQFRFFYAPDQSYTGALTYWQKLTSLVNAGDSNWMLSNHPDAYVYGALMHSAPHLAEDDRLTMWATIFQTILNDIVEQDKNEQPGGSLQMTPSTWSDGCSNPP